MLRNAFLWSLVAAFGFTPIAAAPAAQTSANAVYNKPQPPGELIDIGGRRLHIHCKGNAKGPVVIFEAGLSQFTADSTYGAAQSRIATFARVCIYDRAGLGWSDPVPNARFHLEMVKDLHKLLNAKSLSGPFVLVGHSIGGLLSRLYAKQYPTEVAAVVLVDATPETYLFGSGMAQARRQLIEQIANGLKNAEPGVPVVPMAENTPAEVMMAFTPEILNTVKQEYEAIDLAPQEFKRVNGYGTLGNTPLVVIRRGQTATPPNTDDREWRTAQETLTQLSTRSTLIVAEKSGHVIPYDEPDVVAKAVQSVLLAL